MTHQPDVRGRLRDVLAAVAGKTPSMGFSWPSEAELRFHESPELVARIRTNEADPSRLVRHPRKR